MYQAKGSVLPAPVIFSSTASRFAAHFASTTPM